MGGGEGVEMIFSEVGGAGGYVFEGEREGGMFNARFEEVAEVCFDDSRCY